MAAPYVQPEAIDFLKKIKGNIVVVIVAGKFRTGKSLILNHLSGHMGFGVGNTVNAMTQGLNILNIATPVKLPSGEDASILWVDTEGLGDTNKGQNNDLRIFTLAVLLGSHLIFNIMRNLDSTLLDQLKLVTHMSAKIRISNAEEHQPDKVGAKMYKEIFPSLMFLIRDSELEVVD